MAAAFTWTPNAQAALLRSSTGEIVGTTWAGTMCLWPRKPSQYLLVGDRDDDQVIARCFKCPGCLEFERRILTRRLAEKYAAIDGDLWLVIVQCPRLLQAKLSAAVHRSKTMPVQGFYRLGAFACAFVAVGGRPRPARSRVLRGRRVQVLRIRRSRGLRAWGMLTAGMLRERAEYGTWLNRFYHRGLPARSRDRAWTFRSDGGIAKRRRVTGEDQLRAPAGWRRGPRAARAEILLIPPSEWVIPRLLKAKGPKAGQSAISGEVRAILDALVGKLSTAPATSPPKSRLGSAPAAGASSFPAPALRRPPQQSGYPDIKYLDGWGYNGSLTLVTRKSPTTAQEIDAWRARMEAIARRRDGQ